MNVQLPAFRELEYVYFDTHGGPPFTYLIRQKGSLSFTRPAAARVIGNDHDVICGT